MSFSLPDAVALLARTPVALDALLRGLPNKVFRADEGPGTWSAYDILGHLIVGEQTDWMPRVRHIFEHGDTRAFVPFDMEAHLHREKNPPMDHLLDEFARLRRQNLAALAALDLQPEDLARRGLHPELGPVTLGNHLATWAAHDMTHLHQLSRVLADPYREAVGPWAKYLGVMQCTGHSVK